MWICIVLVMTLGSARPFTVMQSDVEAANITAPINPETFNTTGETVSLNLSKDVTDNSSHLVAILHSKKFVIGAGAIVGEKWILTTSFQLGAFKANELTIRVGSNSAVSGGQLLSVDRVFHHPMFRKFNNDVALLKTADTILSNQPIAVVKSPPVMGDEAVLWVWGNEFRVERNRVDILPMTECSIFYPDYDLTESNICAVLDRVLPFQVGLYGSTLVHNGSLVGLYMGMEADVFKPSICSNLSPLIGWVNAMMKNETVTQLLFPLDE